LIDRRSLTDMTSEPRSAGGVVAQLRQSFAWFGFFFAA